MPDENPDHNEQLGLHHFFQGQMPRETPPTSKALALEKNDWRNALKRCLERISKMYFCIQECLGTRPFFFQLKGERAIFKLASS